MAGQAMADPLAARIVALLAELPGVEAETDAAHVRLKSADTAWVSPVLSAALEGRRGEVVIRPADEAEVLAVLGACVRHRIPVVPRGGGTGHHGHAVPLAGGVILDMTAMDRILAFDDGVAEVEAGATLMQVDAWAREQGWEVRLWPAAKRAATLGGFVSGDGVAKKMCAVFDWPLPSFFTGLAGMLPEGRPVVLAMVGSGAVGGVAELAGAHGGEIAAQQATAEAEASPALTPFYDDTWNNTALHVLRRDRAVTTLHCALPSGATPEAMLATIERVRHRFAGEMWMHAELCRAGGAVAMRLLPLLRWTGGGRLAEIMAACATEGAIVSNAHAYTLEEGAGSHAFKHEVDPFGLLNTGRMASFMPAPEGS